MTNALSYLIPFTLGSAMLWAGPVAVVQDPGDQPATDEAVVADRSLREWTLSYFTGPAAGQEAEVATAEMRRVEQAVRAALDDKAALAAQADAAERGMIEIQNQMVQREVEVATTSTDIASLRAQLEQLRHELKRQPDGPRSTDLADRVLTLRDEIASLEAVLADRQTYLTMLRDDYQRAVAELDQQLAAVQRTRDEEAVAKQYVDDLLAVHLMTAQMQASATANEYVKHRQAYRTDQLQREHDDIDTMVDRLSAYEAAIQALTEAGVRDTVIDLERQRDTIRDHVWAMRSMTGHNTATSEDAELIDLVMRLRDDVQSLRDEVRSLRHTIERGSGHSGPSNLTDRHPGVGR